MYIYHIFVDLFVSVDETCCYHYWIFRNSILRLWWEKLFTRLGGYEGLHGKGFFESVKISLVSLFDFTVSAMWFLNFFPNNSLPCFCKSAVFSFSIVFTWYCKFMIHPKTFNLLWYVLALLLCPRVILFAQHRKAIRLLKFEQLHLWLILRLLEFSTTLLVDP